MPNRSGRGRTTEQKGLGTDHEANRARMLARHVDGTPCWWCGQPMFKDAARNFDGKSLHADHSKSRSLHGKSRANRLMHDLCNKRRGNGRRDHLRPALMAQNAQEYPLGLTIMDWPK